VRNWALIVTVLSAVSMSVAAQVSVEQIEFHGARVFSSGELSAFIDVPSKRPMEDDSLQIRLAALQDSLVERDFLFARVDSFRFSTRRGKKRLHVYVSEGPLARVASYRWLGDSTRVPRSVAVRSITKVGDVFHWSNLVFDTEQLLDFFENNGYPFAHVEIKRIETDSVLAAVSVWLQITSSSLTHVDFVSFAGNRQTREAFLLRTAQLQRGELYDQRRINLAQRRLQRLEFVRRVQPATLVVNEEGRTGALFRIEETRSTLIDIAAGYQPATGNRAGQVSGLANLEFLNLFGTGRRGHLHWERPNSSVQAVDVSYAEPWVLGQPVSLRFDFGQRIQDTLYVQRHYGMQVSFDLSTQLSVWGLARREAVFADSQAAAALRLPDSRTSYLETGFSFDTRDEPLNPRSGVLFSTFIGNGWRERDASTATGAAGSFRQQRGGVDTEVAHEVLPFWIVAADVHARAIRSTEPEILRPDLYRLGGAHTLRGYREEQFLGSRIGWTSLEIRYWLGPLSRVFVFADAGGIYREQLVNSVPEQTTLYRTAVGLGLRLETNLGVWGIDYGVGEEDRILDGKLHISLQSSF
jgi:outer membrane protein insertion porin family